MIGINFCGSLPALTPRDKKFPGVSGTPPLPALSPSQSASQTPQSSPDFRVKYKLNQSTSNLNRPDLLENENMKKTGEGRRSGGSGSNSQGVRGDSKGVSAAIRRAASINTENQNIKERYERSRAVRFLLKTTKTSSTILS